MTEIIDLTGSDPEDQGAVAMEVLATVEDFDLRLPVDLGLVIDPLIAEQRPAPLGPLGVAGDLDELPLVVVPDLVAEVPEGKGRIENGEAIVDGANGVVTRIARWASRAAMKPEPVPMSSTLSVFCTAKSCSSRACTRGANITWLGAEPKGISMSTKAKALCAKGTKSSRRTTESSSSTCGSSTSHGRICCSIMLNRA